MAEKIPWWKQKTLAEALGKPVLVVPRKLGGFGGVVLREDSITYKGEQFPLDGVTATVEAGAALEKHLTATRVAMVGVFALGLKKSRGGESYLTLEGPGFTWVVEVDRDPKAHRKAREFAALVSNTVKQLAQESEG